MKIRNIRIRKNLVITTAAVVIVSLITGAAIVSCVPGSVDAIKNEDAARSYVETVISRMRMGEFISLSQEIIIPDSGSDPLCHNINGYGLDGIDRSPKASRNQVDVLKDTVKYIQNLFGPDAWKTAEFTLSETYGSTGILMWKDLRDGCILNDAQYFEKVNEFWSDLLMENGIDPDTADMQSEEMMAFIDLHDEELPFVSVQKTDGKTWIANISFNGVLTARTGETGFCLVVTDTPVGYRINESFKWNGAEAIASRGRNIHSMAGLIDNRSDLPSEVIVLTDRFIEMLEAGDPEPILALVRNRQTMWCPVADTKTFVRDEEQIAEQISLFKKYAEGASSEHPGIFGYKIDCVNLSGLYKAAWIDTASGLRVSEDEANRTNDAYLAECCEKYDIEYSLSEDGGIMLDWDGSEILSQKGIYRDVYPVQLVPYTENSYTLYRIVLFFDDVVSKDGEYFTFYISDQSGPFEIISSLYLEGMEECGVAVMGLGD